MPSKPANFKRQSHLQTDAAVCAQHNSHAWLLFDGHLQRVTARQSAKAQVSCAHFAPEALLGRSCRPCRGKVPAKWMKPSSTTNLPEPIGIHSYGYHPVLALRYSVLRAFRPMKHVVTLLTRDMTASASGTACHLKDSACILLHTRHDFAQRY